MEYLQAKGIAGGIAIGKISVYNKSEQTVKRMRTDDTEEEITRYEQAREKAVSEEFIPAGKGQAMPEALPRQPWTVYGLQKK